MLQLVFFKRIWTKSSSLMLQDHKHLPFNNCCHYILTTHAGGSLETIIPVNQIVQC